MLEVDAMQTYTRNHDSLSTPADYRTCLPSSGRLYPPAGRKGSDILLPPWGAENISDNGGNASYGWRKRLSSSVSPYRNHAYLSVSWWWSMLLRVHLRITFGLQPVLRAVCLSRRTAWRVIPTTPTIRTCMRQQTSYTSAKWGFMAGDRYPHHPFPSETD